MLNNKELDFLKLKGWNYSTQMLKKELKFDNFKVATLFINNLAQIADELDHHPEIYWVYNKVVLTLRTHEAGNIVTQKDIELAKKIESII